MTCATDTSLPCSHPQITLRPLYTHPNAGVDDAAVVAGGGPGAAEANGTGPASAQSPASPGSDPGVDHERVMDLLQQGLFMHEGGFDGGWQRA